MALEEAVRRGLKMPAAATEALPYLHYLRATLPKGWTAEPPHIRLISEHLDAVEAGQIDRLAIHMPPRHGKSQTVTVRYAPYCLERRPGIGDGNNVLLTAYNERYARKLSRAARTIARTRLLLDPEKQATDEWALATGAILMARGVGSPPTGTGFGRIIIDDPIRRREDAESEVFREKLWDWYTDDLYSRLEPGGAIVLVMTCWHEDGLDARAIASEPGRWTVLRLSAIAEEGDPLGRAIGEALWPDRYDVAALERIHEVMRREEGERSWLALFQQRPSAKEGMFFKVSKLAIEPEAPAKMVRVARAWDKAATAGGGAFTAGVKMGLDHEGIYWILDVVRGQWDTAERDQVIRQTAALDGKSVKVRGPQDPGQAGKADAQAFTRMLAGYTVVTKPVSGSKEMRADPYSSQVNAGNVRLVEGPWNRDFIEEHRAFPLGKYKDQVDAAADAFEEVSSRRVGHVY